MTVVEEHFEFPETEQEWTVFVLQGGNAVERITDVMDSGGLNEFQRNTAIRTFNKWVIQNLDKFTTQFISEQECAVMRCKQFPGFQYHVYDQPADLELWEVINSDIW